MNKISVHFAAISLAVALAPGSARATADLSQDEAMMFIKGKARQTQNTTFGAVSLDFRANGSLYGTNQGQSDSGTWEVKDGKLCLKWRRWDYEGCGALQRIDGNRIQHLWPDGRVHFIAPAD